MRDSEYTTLAFFAQALATEPDRADDFAAAVKQDLAEATFADLYDAEELVQAIDAILQQWHVMRHEGRAATLNELVEVGTRLEQSGQKIAGLALFAAVQDLLARKQREVALTEEERQIADRLPELARAAG